MSKKEKRKTELLRNQILTKFGSISEFERLAGLKHNAIHVALNRIDRNKGKYYSVHQISEKSIRGLIDQVRPMKKSFLSKTTLKKTRDDIVARYGSVEEFCKQTGFGRTKLFQIFRFERHADDLLSILYKQGC